MHGLLATLAEHLQRRRTVETNPLDVMAIKTNYCDATMAMLSRNTESVVATI
jgi:hypothetical protein